MASFEIHWRSSIKKDLRGIPSHEVARNVTAVEHLADETFPHGSQKLSSSEYTYRIRIGDYRVVYEVLLGLKLIEVQRVRHRKDVYR